MHLPNKMLLQFAGAVLGVMKRRMAGVCNTPEVSDTIYFSIATNKRGFMPLFLFEEPL